jgi:sulfate transport system substrate-binding protein
VRDPDIAAAHAADFPKLTLYDFSEAFGDWQKTQATYFADNGVFDQIYKPGQ